jgi:hypothetical protein
MQALAGVDLSGLLRAFSAGEPIPKVTIASGSRVVTLTDVPIANYQEANRRGDEPLVTVEFAGAAAASARPLTARAQIAHSGCEPFASGWGWAARRR